MKKILLLSFSLFVCFSAFGQQRMKIKNFGPQLAQPAMETMNGAAASVPASDNIFLRNATEVGETTYDLQSNSSMPSRVVNHDGNILLSWTYGNSAPAAGVPERGTAFRMKNSAGDWSPEPTARIEPVRTGWPSTNVTAGGTITNLAHSADYDLVFSTRPLSGGDWDVNFIPTNTPVGALWPRSATGGPDGNSVHAIAVTTPVAFDGVIHEGVDGHLLYWRSLDEGATWDVQDFVIPELDSSKYVTMTNDAYSISSNGNTVAVSVFTNWNDLNVFISRDNGDTWERRTVVDFPLKKYVINEGYTIDQLPEDPNRPDTLAIRSNDGTGMVFVDDNEKVHLVFSEMYVADLDLLDTGSNYYPGSDGVQYWNEDMEDGVSNAIAFAQDMDGDSILNQAITLENATYFESLSSQSSIGMDIDGNLYVTYCSINELHVNDAGQGSFNVYMVSSADGGETWDETPRDLTAECEETAPFAEFGYEFYFAKMATKVDDHIHVLVQADLQPGTSVQTTEIPDGPEANQMFYMAVPVTSNAEDLTEIQELNIFPNPASTTLNIEMDVIDASFARINMYNGLGQMVYSKSINNVQNTAYHVIDTRDFANGSYFVQIATEKEQLTQTVVINK